MSRTIKDKKIEFRYGEDIFAYNKPDLRKKKKNEHQFWPQATPSWWTRIIMNRPHRRAVHLWEHEVVLTDVEDADPIPETPKKYYW